jgi:hypothetical protein
VSEYERHTILSIRYRKTKALNMNFTQEQYKLIYTAVRRHQIEKTVLNSPEYQECSEILDEMFDTVYTQRVEQPT